MCACAIGTLAVLALATAPAETPAWRADPVFRAISGRLDAVRAIDNHTHLLDEGPYDPALDTVMPLGLRSAYAPYVKALRDRLGVVSVAGDPAATHSAAARARATLLARVGGRERYWADHLDYSNTEVALVNQAFHEGTDGRRLLWVPQATTLLHPLAADALMARSPGHHDDISRSQNELKRFLAEAGQADVPLDLAGYLRFVDETLARWKQQGAVALKFYDAYLRTIVFEDVPSERASALYARGRTTPLPRDEYLALQDHIARHIFLGAGRLKLPVHVHSSLGVPPFLRTLDADVRNLEPVLTDVRFFETQFVLIHGGMPLVEHAAYLALKPHVWFDISAMPFLYTVADLAAVLRKAIVWAPEKVLFGTDAYPGVPGGADIHHIASSRMAREALALALTGLVRDEVLDQERAVAVGTGILQGNARRLYGDRIAYFSARATTGSRRAARRAGR
jgi:uncharacterized protein